MVFVRALALPRFNKGMSFKPQTDAMQFLLRFEIPIVEDLFYLAIGSFDLPKWVYCPKELFTDIGKIEQILKNFLSNALKFTPEKGKVSLLFSSGKEKNDFASPSLSKLDPNKIFLGSDKN